MISVWVEKDLVLIGLGGRRRDVLLSCRDAEHLARALAEAADRAERGELTLVKGERWGAKVVSYDGLVAIRFQPPSVGATDRVPLTPQAARALADDVTFKGQQAAYRVRFCFTGRA